MQGPDDSLQPSTDEGGGKGGRAMKLLSRGSSGWQDGPVLHRQAGSMMLRERLDGLATGIVDRGSCAMA